MAIRRLLEIVDLSGEIEVLSGLHIGAGSDEIHIGGIDSPVVRDPRSGHPYVPGSSLKGKIRALLEMATGYVAHDGGPYATEDGTNPITRLFGNGKVHDRYDGGPARAAFSDCPLLNPEELIPSGGLTESKYEVSMNRLTGTVRVGSLRQTERVPRGARFGFKITCKIFDCDGDGGEADRENIDLLMLGLRLLERDALGGSGSRGYGRVRFILQDEAQKSRIEALDIAAVLDRFKNPEC